MKKLFAMAMTLLLVLSLLVGCGAKGTADSYAAPGEYEYAEEGYYVEAPAYAETEAPAEEYSAAGSNESTAVAANRKLIRTVSLSLETKTYDDLMSDITKRITECGGYLENMDANTRYNSTNRDAYMTIRIPVTKLDSFLGQVSEISNVVSRSESTEDVTLSYVDMESHRDALKIEQERLLALLENAENLTDILEIEGRLTEVRYELEYMESQLRTYDNLVEYATVHLNISEVQDLTDVEEKGFWEEIGEGFTDSIEGVWEFLKDAFSFIIIAFPYLLLIAAIIGINVLIIVLIVRGCKKRARKRAEKKQAVQEKTE